MQDHTIIYLFDYSNDDGVIDEEFCNSAMDTADDWCWKQLPENKEHWEIQWLLTI